ncbi:polyprotein, partial [Phytophthora megakarya]
VEYFEYDQLRDGGSDLEEHLGEPNSLSTPQRELRDSVEVQNADDEDVEEGVEGVIASGEPRERYLSSVGDNESGSEHGSDSDYRDVFEEDSDEELGAGESFRHSSRIRRPNVRMKDYELELPESLVIQAMHAVMDPVSVQAALDAPDAEQWVEALNKEYSEMLRNNTWELVEKPEGVKVLTSRWVFVRKRNAQGQVERHRARITIRGCQQKYGLDFWETYAPVVCMEAVRLVLLLALHYNLECRHIDFVTAFLNGPIDAEIYMKQPEFFDDGTGRVCKLLRSLYGLKQAPRMWYQTLDKYLKECGFKRSKMDGGIYYRWVDSSPIFLTLYVDDIVISASAENTKLVLTELANKFQVKDLGNVNHLLSMEIKYIPGQSLTISQRGYIGRILERFKMDKCKSMPTPQAKGNLPLPGDPDREVVCVNSNPDMDYQCIVGSLQYLEHEVMAKRVLRYLQGTRDYGLVWIKPIPRGIRLVAYADADLGSEKDDRKSITGYVLQLNGCTFAYKSKKQSIMTDDTCSAEFVAASECSTMIMWTHNLCKELKLRRTERTVLYEDNQATIKVMEEVSSGYKVRSVDLKFHKVRDFVERKVFRVEYCPSEDNLADIFTKPLGPQQFCKLRQMLNVVPVSTEESLHAACDVETVNETL